MQFQGGKKNAQENPAKIIKWDHFYQKMFPMKKQILMWNKSEKLFLFEMNENANAGFWVYF